MAFCRLGFRNHFEPMRGKGQGMIKVNPEPSRCLSIPANLMMVIPCADQVDVLFLCFPPGFWASPEWDHFHLRPLEPHCIVFHPPEASPGDVLESFGDHRESRLFIQLREVVHEREARNPGNHLSTYSWRSCI
jgi:hypothetical protein